MKLTITREQLQEGLVAVAAAYRPRPHCPILSNILLEATKDGIRLSGTDLDISVSTTVPASVDQEGAITLPARKLVEIVRELPSAAIRFTASGEQRVTIECGRSKFRLLGLPREEFPAFPAVKFEGGWKAPAERSPEADRPRGLRGEHRGEPADPERRALGAPARADADGGHQRAPARPDGRAHPAGGQPAQADLIVPPKALEQIRRLFGAEDEVEIARSENHLGFRSSRTQVYTRLIEGPVPQLRAGDPPGERQGRPRPTRPPSPRRSAA